MVEGGIEVHQNVRVETLSERGSRLLFQIRADSLHIPSKFQPGSSTVMFFSAPSVSTGRWRLCVKRLVFGRELVMQLQILSRVEAQEEGIRPQLSADVLVNSFDRFRKDDAVGYGMMMCPPLCVYCPLDGRVVDEQIVIIYQSVSPIGL